MQATVRKVIIMSNQKTLNVTRYFSSHLKWEVDT